MQTVNFLKTFNKVIKYILNLKSIIYIGTYQYSHLITFVVWSLPRKTHLQKDAVKGVK